MSLGKSATLQRSLQSQSNWPKQNGDLFMTTWYLLVCFSFDNFCFIIFVCLLYCLCFVLSFLEGFWEREEKQKFGGDREVGRKIWEEWERGNATHTHMCVCVLYIWYILLYIWYVLYKHKHKHTKYIVWIFFQFVQEWGQIWILHFSLFSPSVCGL